MSIDPGSFCYISSNVEIQCQRDLRPRRCSEDFGEHTQLTDGRKQVLAILTRLAFARLFATAGHPVPVILDDALLHSDDDRIEVMFDALHRASRDQQILVSTCRQPAFAALGVERAKVAVKTA